MHIGMQACARTQATCRTAVRQVGGQTGGRASGYTGRSGAGQGGAGVRTGGHASGQAGGCMCARKQAGRRVGPQVHKFAHKHARTHARTHPHTHEHTHAHTHARTHECSPFFAWPNKCNRFGLLGAALRHWYTRRYTDTHVGAPSMEAHTYRDAGTDAVGPRHGAGHRLALGLPFHPCINPHMRAHSCTHTRKHARSAPICTHSLDQHLNGAALSCL